MRASEGKKVQLKRLARSSGHPNLPLRSTSKYFKFQRISSGLRGVLSWIDRYGADSSSRKSALSALYLAAGRLLSEPSMTTAPSIGAALIVCPNCLGLPMYVRDVEPH